MTADRTGRRGGAVKDRVVAHGDQVRVGDSVFLFLLEETGVPQAGAIVEMKEAGLIAGSTIELSADAARLLKTQRVPPESRAARDLGVLLRISTSINSIRDHETLQRRLLESIFEAVPAQRGARLLARR